MKYISTRGQVSPEKFCDILLAGLANDGGLFMPSHYPQLSDRQLTEWRNLSYSELALEIFSLFIDDIETEQLKKLINDCYNTNNFAQQQIVPVTKINEHSYLVGLSYGPTLAFKDIAMQMLGQLFEYELTRRGEKLNILGATSGDTGSAAEYAMRGKSNINVFMLSPHGRMSEFQQAQMFSLQEPNIFNLAVKGVFDDCQDIVKAISNDLEFKKNYHIGTVNSINWARLLAQVVYYVWSYLRVSINNQQKVSFTVPTGNFGNVCAGHVAKMMGLPIKRLVVAVNENDVLDQFFKTGIYKIRDSASTLETSSPSMDISKASNFERFIFDLLERDSEQVHHLFADLLVKQGYFDLSQHPNFIKIQQQYGFYSSSSNHQLRLQNIKQLYEQYQILIDPHTADAWHVAQQFIDDDVPMLILETALPVKFSKTIFQSVGFTPQYPTHLKDIEQLPKRVQVLDADVGLIKQFIKSNANKN